MIIGGREIERKEKKDGYLKVNMLHLHAFMQRSHSLWCNTSFNWRYCANSVFGN